MDRLDCIIDTLLCLEINALVVLELRLGKEDS